MAKVLHWIGWLVAAGGVLGVAVFTAFWAAGDVSAEQGVSLVLGTALATVLSGATTYGAGVNIGLGAERLQLAAREADTSLLSPGHPAPGRVTGETTQ